ncbi:MAG: hypothetical protein U9R60_12365 [Bacteroidota bacterium]|nr:hypothetical protein [Bacteroidota bacterium]
MIRYLLIFVFLLATVSQAAAQEPDNKTLKKARRDSIRQTRNFRFSGMGGPAYTPELKLIVGANLLVTFSTNISDTSLQRSSNITYLAVGIEGAIILMNKGNVFLKNDRFRIMHTFWYKNMPDNYFGVGYEPNLYIPKGPNTTAYHRNWFQFMPEFLFEAVKGLFAGILIDINQTLSAEVQPLMQGEPYYYRYGPNNFNAGFGVIGQYDTRDNVSNAYKGVFFKVVAIDYSSVFGSENNYQIIDMDYRQYKQLWRPRHILAWTLRSRISMGNIPYAELSMVGSPYDLRGYLWGRFRDRTMVLGILEYRHMFNPVNSKRKENFWSRHGIAMWAGAGFLGHHINDWNLPQILPNAGLGYRLELQPRLNVRIDVGFGIDGSTGVYVQLTEAF